MRKTVAWLFLLATLARLGFQEFRFFINGGAPFQTGDWLINYEGGFVRRGLFGSLLELISPTREITLVLLALVHFVLYGAVFFFILKQLQKSEYSWLYICIFLGPGALGFHLWDSGASFRKELLAYVALVIMVSTLKSRPMISAIGLITSLFIFTLGVYSWEPTVLFLPVFLYLTFQNNLVKDSKTKKFLVSAIFSLVGTSGALVSSVYHGDSSTASNICKSLVSRGWEQAKICSGAIDAIGWSSEFTIKKVVDSYPTYLIYLPLIFLALIPVLLVSSKLVGKMPTIIITASFLPLFFIVNDYGRWASMACFSLLFALSATGNIIVFTPKYFSVLAIPYLFIWVLPHSVEVGEGLTWPLMGLPLAIVKLFELLVNN